MMTDSASVHAPRDPREKGPFLYLMDRTPLTASRRADGRFADETDLDMGRLRSKLAMMNALSDPALLAQFDTAAGFRRTVAAIGIAVSAPGGGRVRAEWVLYGSRSRYGSGTRFVFDCPADGRENLLWLGEADESGDEAACGELLFFFDCEGACAEATVLLYTRPGVACTQTVREAPPALAGPGWQALLARAQTSAGDARLRQKLVRAQQGAPLTLGFIGGSITQGAGAKPIHTACYAYQAWQQLQTLLGVPVGYTKAGIGGTPSELGMIRMEKDLLRHGVPDIAVVEFAVNDNDDETQGRCYETLVRQILALPGAPAVVLLFSVFCDDWNLQERLAPIGRYYGLPMVSVRDAVVPQFGLTPETGRVLSKRQYFYDSFHPTNEGHLVMAGCLTELFRRTLAAPAPAAVPVPAQPLLGRTFDGIRLLDRAHALPGAQIDAGDFAARDENLPCAEPDALFRAEPQFADNWLHAAGAGDAPFVLRLRCRSLFLVEKDSSEDAFGAAEIRVDGRLCRTVDPHTVGWVHCGALELLEGDTEAPHEITVRMTEKDRGRAFAILGFGVC